LNSVAFFIAIITPGYFKSVECRRELQEFARKSKKLGVTEFVLPLSYVDLYEMSEEQESDDLLALVREFQWEDWTDLRFAERTSEPYRRAVASIASRLVDANRRAEQLHIPQIATTDPSQVVPAAAADEPGLLDRFAGAEESLPILNSITSKMTSEVESVGTIFNSATKKIRRGSDAGSGFAAKLAAAKVLARDLGEPAERILGLGNQFATVLHSVDDGFRALIIESSAQLESGHVQKSDACSFFESVRGMATSAQGASDSVDGMLDAIGPIERMSRDLRPPLRTLRQGLTLILEAREIAEDWVTMIDGSGVDCSPE
jgi:hypothetical protein